MHNLGTVIRFEIIRMLKKKSFWFMALGFPLVIAVIFGIVFWSNQTTIDAAKKLQDQEFSIGIRDEAGIISPQIIKEMKIRKIETRDDGIKDVKQGEIDAFFYFPLNLKKNKIELYGQDVGLFKNSRYSAVADVLLQQSVGPEVSQAQRIVLEKTFSTSTVTYQNGKEYDGFKQLIAPGLFLVLFYLLIAFFGGQMLTSTIEEKENRTIEMLLTTINPRALITGKIIGLVSLAFIQGSVILLPVVLMYWLAGSQISGLSLDLTNIPLDPLRIAIGAAIFIFSFLMFTGLLVAFGAMMPTAKEASQWFGIIIMFIFGPLYGVTSFISYPESPFVQFLSLFPLTAPVPLMLRNAVGNLSLQEAVLGIAILAVSAVITMLFAVRIFRYGAMQYDSRVSFSVLRSKRKAGKVSL